MRPSPELRPTVWDALVAVLVTALAVGCAAVFWFHGTSARGEAEAVVFLDGREADRFPLSDGPLERTYASRGYTLRVMAAEGRVWVEEADCPTQDCVRTGAVSRPGQSIVCLPARAVVQLAGTDRDSDGGVDAVVG